MMSGAKFGSAADAVAFMQAGKARFTLRSVKTGTRFTYRMAMSNDGNVFFVGLLTGSDNEASFSYLGIVNAYGFKRTAKSKIGEDAPGHKAFAWTWRKLSAGELPDVLEVWHEGACGKCGRALTVPESIAAGIGPECASQLGVGLPSSPRVRGMGTRAGRRAHKEEVKLYNDTVMKFRPKKASATVAVDLPDDSVDDLYPVK